MTYGERLKKAIDYAGISQTELLTKVKKLIAAEGRRTRIAQQTVSKAFKSGSSKYSFWFARACGVNVDWLENEIGEMVGTSKPIQGGWPFVHLEELRYRRLTPENQKFIEKAVTTMVESFEDLSESVAKKKRAAQ